MYESTNQMDPDFTLGTPELVCRWRLSSCALPLENRHLRALKGRTLPGGMVSTELVAWAKQHIEWTLTDGAADHPDGVLMIVVDDHGRAAMSVGPKTDEGLLWGLDEACVPSGSASLVEDLARTVGFTVRRAPGLLDDVRSKRLRIDEAFLVSDEFGVVVPEDCAGEAGARFAEGYQKLLDKMASK